MSNVARAVTRACRSARWIKPGAPRSPHRSAQWRTPPGRPLPQFAVTRRPRTSRAPRGEPMGSVRRLGNYAMQTTSSTWNGMTPGQYRRWQHKHNRAADPRGTRTAGSKP